MRHWLVAPTLKGVHVTYVLRSFSQCEFKAEQFVIRNSDTKLPQERWMAAAPSCTWVDCPAVWGWTMMLHWQGTGLSVVEQCFVEEQPEDEVGLARMSEPLSRITVTSTIPRT
jgi:hypothetical protein